MPRPAPSALESDIAAALDWWREAGVNAAYVDEPRAWLADPEPAKGEAVSPELARDAAPPPAPLPVRRLGGAREQWPAELAAFKEWWLTEPSLDDGGLAPRVAPVGGADGELMVLMAMPEEVDRERLLSGPEGRLLSGFLSAAGLADNQVYLAAVLPRHTPLADWATLADEGIGDVLAHHVALARPKRLLVLGQSILPLCGHDPAQGAQNLRSFNHEGGTVPALFEAGLDRLLAKPQLRARLWKRWLEWTDGQTWDLAHD